MLRVLPRNEAAVHPQDLSNAEVDIPVQIRAQNHEVEAVVGRGVEVENVTSTYIVYAIGLYQLNGYTKLTELS